MLWKFFLAGIVDNGDKVDKGCAHFNFVKLINLINFINQVNPK